MGYLLKCNALISVSIPCEEINLFSPGYLLALSGTDFVSLKPYLGYLLLVWIARGCFYDLLKDVHAFSNPSLASETFMGESCQNYKRKVRALCAVCLLIVYFRVMFLENGDPGRPNSTFISLGKKN